MPPPGPHDARPPAPAAPPAGATDEALLDAARALPDGERGEARGTPRSPRALRALRRLADLALPDRLRNDSFDARRRARFIVLTVVLELPFLGVLVQQLLASGLHGQALWALGFGAAVLACPLLLRVTRSHHVAGAVLVLATTAAVFVQAFTDAGLADPILYWVAVLPLIGALLGGLPLALASAGLNLVGVGTLYALAESGYPFPHLTAPGPLRLAALLSIATATLFALAWGWVYEGFTLREWRRTRGHLAGLRTALSASEARYRSLFDDVPVALYRSTTGGEFLMVNQTMLRMLGYATAEELLAVGAAGVYADPAERERFVTAVESTPGAPFTAVWRTRDGRTLHVRENVHAVRDAPGPDGAPGRVRYYEGVARDVTEQLRAQQGLRQSEERFRALVQHASDVTLVLDRTVRFAFLSPAAERLLGLSPEDVLGQSPFAWVHPDDRRRLTVLARRVLARPGPFNPVEFRALHADGHYLYVEAVGSNNLANPHVRGLILNVRDVTERKRAEAVLVKSKEQAEEVARLKSAFLANMSHEIRTPLTGILGFTSVLAEEVTDPQHREFVGLIEKSGRRLMDTLNSVLELARLEAGRVELAAEPVALADAAHEAVRLLAPLARDRGLRLEAHVVAPDAEAPLDRAALDRVLTNLIGNALKFTEAGGVTVEVDGDERSVRLAVRDTGVGIDAEFLPRLFKEFEQESTGIARSHEGTGLGLAITRQLVERMQGTIEVTSEKGAGTTFTVTFPRTREGPRPAPDAPGLPPEAPARRVLVVDDNPNTRMLMERMLRVDYNVALAGSAPEALRVAEDEGPFDAVLLDINLGGDVSGEDVMRRLRHLPAYADTPTVAFTAYALPGDRERFLHAGFSGYLSKPFTKRQLLAAVAEVLGDGPAPPGLLRHPLPGLPTGDGAWHRPAPVAPAPPRP